MCMTYFIQDVQNLYFKKGDEYRRNLSLTDELCLRFEDIRLSKKESKMSKQDFDIMMQGDSGQGDRLNNKKKNKQVF